MVKHMKIKETTISKTVKRTIALRHTDDKTLVDYFSIEPSVSITIDNPTLDGVKQAWNTIDTEISDQLSSDPEWIKDANYFKEKVR